MSTICQRFCLVLLLLWLFGGFLAPSVSAQLSVNLRASAPLVENFPQITIYLAVTDGTGRHLPGLNSNNFSVLEDESMLLDLAVREQEVGTRQVFVLNTSEDMKVRDALGRSRFDLARQALLSWWQLPSASLLRIDDLSLVTTDGVLVSQSHAAADLASRLDRYSPSFEGPGTGYELMLSALDLSSDAPVHPGMPTHMIFFTPLLRIPRDVSISNVIARALQTRTTVHVILLGQLENLEQPEAEPLRQIAEATGGQFLLLDPELGLRNFASNILAQRTQYELTYASQAITSGSHRVQVRLTDVDLEVFSEIRTFDIEVLPPQVAFIQPPDRLLRQTDDPNLPLDALPPTAETLRVLVTFPDEHPRPIVKTQLIVDGEIVSERLDEPFDAIEWNLSSYFESGSHTIQAVVEDVLGLQSETIELPVTIEVRTPPRGLATLRTAMGPVLTALAVLIAGIVLAVSMISFGRSRTSAARPEREFSQPARHQLKRAGLRRQVAPELAEALLIPLGTSDEDEQPIPLTGVDFILGRDPSMTPAPFPDPSVSGIHARITRLAGGGYLLRDQGSVAGTWLNFEEVPDDGMRLNHGDLIHIGRITLRFQLTTPPEAAQIRVRRVNQDHGQAQPQEIES